MPKQLKWTRDEVILALELYINNPDCVGRDDHPKVKELSKLLRSLPIYPETSRGPTFRNPAGVALKLFNLARFDTSKQKRGTNHGAVTDELVWRSFAHDKKRLSATAAAIRKLHRTPEAEPLSDNDLDEEEEAVEGRILTRTHKRRERNKKLVKKKKEEFAKLHGRLFCEACGFDFCAAYGQRGEGFIEVHHTVPVSKLAGKTKTNLDDLKLVCANCHRIIHRQQPWLEWAELIQLTKNER